MHEGFINFNAGTEGKSMIEGRISAGVMVGEGSDLGGGSSTMGTLSGGNKIVISLGRECLLGANAGVGIPWATAARSKPAFMSRLAPRSRCWTTTTNRCVPLRPGILRANPICSSVGTPRPVPLNAAPTKSAIALNEELHANN